MNSPIALNKDCLDEDQQSRFWAKVHKTSECWEWTASTKQNGYGIFTLNSRNRYAHRLSFALAFGNIKPDMQVLHRCDNPRCVNPEHLFLGTQKDNIQDCVRKGRHAFQKFPQIRGRGCGRPFTKKTAHKLTYWERRGRAKLSDKMVLFIRKEKASGKAGSQIAKENSLGLGTVYDILSGKTWKHLK